MEALSTCRCLSAPAFFADAAERREVFPIGQQRCNPVDVTRVWVASSLSTAPADAVLDIAARLRVLGFPPPHLRRRGVALVFVGPRLAIDGKALYDALGDLLDPLPFVSWVGPSAFHDQRVPEKRPGLVVAVLDDVEGELRHTLWDQFGMPMAAQLLADAMVPTARFLSISPASGPGGLDVLAALDEGGGETIGAIAHRRQHLRPGITSLAVRGPRVVSTVAQATRQLGPTRVVTSASQNMIRELDGKPALQQLMSDLPVDLKQHLGRLGGSLFASFGIADTDTSVLRSITGVDQRTGAVAVSDEAAVGSEVAFSLRDQAAARDELEAALADLDAALAGRTPKLFVVFSSSARDSTLLGAPLWDVTRVLSRFGPDVPVVGGAGAGELAHIAGRTLVMGHTVVVSAIV